MLYPHAKFGADLPPHGRERKKWVFLPAGQPPVLKLLRCPILRFFAPQGRHDSWINVKFGMAEGTEGQIAPKFSPNFTKMFPPTCQIYVNFTLPGGYLGIFGPLKTQKFPKLQTFWPRRGEFLAQIQ